MIVSAQYTQDASANDPEIRWESTLVDYGTIANGDENNATRYFKFVNVGKSPLIISSCHGSCGCTVPTCPTEPIQPGGSGYVKVHYDVKRVGEFTKTVTVASNAKEASETLKIHGIVTGPDAGTPFKIKPQDPPVNKSPDVAQKGFTEDRTEKENYNDSYANNRINSGNTPGNKKGKYYALLIAVQDYQNSEIQSLENPVSDSRKFATVLKANYIFDSIRVLKNPSKSDIMRTIYAYRSSLKEDDNFLLFYSGHGYWDKESEQGYWFPVNADRSDPSTWISNSDIKDEIKPMKCLHTLLVSDACFSGGIFRTRDLQLSGASRTVQQLYQTKSRKAMTSGALTEVPDKSVFLKYMIDALQTNRDAYISSEKLFGTFKENAINNSKIAGLIPQFGVIMDTDDRGGDFIFIKK